MAIPRTRASTVCVVFDHLLVVRLRDPVSDQVLHFVPGGAIEPGERPWEAALRETREETGLEVVVDRDSEIVARYPFVWAGKLYDTTTYFYRAAPARWTMALPEVGPIGETPLYQLGALWVPLADAEEWLSFDKTIWQITRSLL